MVRPEDTYLGSVCVCDPHMQGGRRSADHYSVRFGDFMTKVYRDGELQQSILEIEQVEDKTKVVLLGSRYDLHWPADEEYPHPVLQMWEAPGDGWLISA